MAQKSVKWALCFDIFLLGTFMFFSLRGGDSRLGEVLIRLFPFLSGVICASVLIFCFNLMRLALGYLISLAVPPLWTVELFQLLPFSVSASLLTTFSA